LSPRNGQEVATSVPAGLATDEQRGKAGLGAMTETRDQRGDGKRKKVLWSPLELTYPLEASAGNPLPR